MTPDADTPTEVSDSLHERVVEPHGWDRGLLLSVVALICFGLLMIQSASMPESIRLYGSPYSIALRQVRGLVLGAVLSVPLLLLSWPRVRRVGSWMYAATLLLMLLTATPLGREVNGAQRWLALGPINLQPSELVKPFMAMFLADLLSRNIGRIRQVAVPVSVGLSVLPLAFLLVFNDTLQRSFGIPFVGQSDLGMAIEYGWLMLAALWVAGLSYRSFGFLVLLGMGAVGAGIAVAPYRVRRVLDFLPGSEAPVSYQIQQGYVAMAMGGLGGVGLGQGLSQVRGYTPEAHTDMIAVVVAEELGVVGWSLLAVLQVSLLAAGMRVAGRASTLYDAVVASVISAAFGFQAFVNLGVVVGMVPSKGLVLPFVTYGASAATANVIMVALLLRIGTQGIPKERG